MVLRVAVIGAGAAGLVVLRQMSSRLDEFEPVGYERMSVIGGTWAYTDKVERHGERPVLPSMYKNLRTNLPKEVMAYPDFPFPNQLPSFLGHRDVRQYLEAYAKHFDLFRFINFNYEVERVHPQHDDAGTLRWLVRVRDLKKTDHGEFTESEFDAVIVCNGHYTDPFMPDIPGLEDFKGEVLHSHSYRTPDKCKGKLVIVLGAQASGVDLANEIASVADKVWLCHRKPAPVVIPFPENVKQAPAISKMTRDSAVLSDGQVLKVDAVIFCTGYRYSFPFLTPECHCSVTEDQRIVPLYKHLINTHYTSLSFIGITKFICPFPAFHCQAVFVMAVLSGKIQLPSEEEMNEDTRIDYEWRLSNGYSSSDAHTMGSLQWDYNDMLAKTAGHEPLPPVVRKLYEHCRTKKSERNYREYNYKLINCEEFVNVS